MGRGRERRGAHQSVAGSPADETLEDLVAQFSDRYAFARELVQNSLDAGAARVELVFTWADGVLDVAFVDDGEGMDRATIEGYLLTLFRSTKEDDLTKIGKFGIGFVSLFAMQPFEVVVTTGRDLLAHRVTFDEHRAWTLEELDEPIEGTTVCLRVRCGREAARKEAERVVASAERWCRFAPAEVVHRAEGLSRWTPGRIEGRFEVDAPVSVTVEEDGLRAVLGPCGLDKPPVVFVSGGLTLWTGHLDVVPGVTFVVEGRHLEHTLTRDNVRRDRHFTKVVDRLTAAARHRLTPAVTEELVRATREGPRQRLDALLFACRSDAAFTLADDEPWVPAVPEPVTLAHVRRRLAKPILSWFGSREPMVCRDADDPLARRLARDHLVIRDAHDGVVARWLAEHIGAAPVDGGGYRWVQPVSSDPALVSLVAAAERQLGRSLACGEVHGHGADRLAAAAPHRDVLLAPGDNEHDTVVVRHDHPLVQKLLALPVELAGVLLAAAVRVALEGDVPVGWRTVHSAVDALPDAAERGVAR